MATSVYLNRAPHHVRLHAWGRAETGWWGCVSWRQRVRTAAGDSEFEIAAWVPAATLSKPGYGAAADVSRVRLAADSRAWPAPPGWPSWYAGVWLEGPVPLPPGAEAVTGAAWRKRR
jgi:hypothetical protein